LQRSKPTTFNSEHPHILRLRAFLVVLTISVRASPLNARVVGQTRDDAMQMCGSTLRVLLCLVLLSCSENNEVRELREVAVPSSQQDSQCAGRSLDRCGGDAACRVVSGRRLDRGRGCWVASEPLGCRAADRACGLALTAARDPRGACYLFATTCIPIGWAAIYGSDDKLCHSSTENCDPP
jgi:hypothetical protein